jgi:hypothetical protein
MHPATHGHIYFTEHSVQYLRRFGDVGLIRLFLGS